MRHPGTVLREEFMQPNGLSQYRVAVDVGVPPRRINQIVHGQRGITADTALRLARYFGTTPELWMNLQVQWELARAAERLPTGWEDEVRVFDPSKPARGRGRPRKARTTRARAQLESHPVDYLFIDE